MIMVAKALPRDGCRSVRAKRGERRVRKLVRLPSNLRQTTHECVYLVRHGHFRSRDKDGGHIIRSAIAENPIRHANFTALSSIEPDCPPKFYIAWNREFSTCLLLWPWPRPDDLHVRTWPVSPEDVPADQKWTFYVKAFESYRITYIPTDIHNIQMPP